MHDSCLPAFKKALAATALLVGCLLVLGGCSSKTPIDPVGEEIPPPPPISAVDTSEPVALSWMVPGDRPRGTDAVWTEINKSLQEQWNATVTLRHVQWQVWVSQSATLLAADSAPDAMYVAGAANYGSLAKASLLMPVTQDQLVRYAPDIAAAVSAWSDSGLRDCEIGGVSYMVPAAGNLQITDMPVLVRGDLREGLGIAPITTLDELDAFLQALAESDSEEVVPWNANPDSLLSYLWLSWFQPEEKMPVVQEFPFLAFSLAETNPKVVQVLEEPGFVDALLRLRSLSLSGALPQGAIHTRLSTEQLWMAGQSAVLIDDLNTVSTAHARTLLEHPEWRPEWVLLNPDARRVRDPLNLHGMAMPAAAEEPERTLLVLNELFADKTLQDLSTAGITGVHRIAGAVYQPGEFAKEYPYDRGGAWGWSNQSLMLPPGNGTWLRKQITDQWLGTPDRVLAPAQAAFLFDMAPVAREISALGGVLGTQAGILLGGATDTVSDEMEQLRAAFSEAGMEKVQLEMQRQLDEYLKQTAD